MQACIIGSTVGCVVCCILLSGLRAVIFLRAKDEASDSRSAAHGVPEVSVQIGAAHGGDDEMSSLQRHHVDKAGERTGENQKILSPRQKEQVSLVQHLLSSPGQEPQTTSMATLGHRLGEGASYTPKQRQALANAAVVDVSIGETFVPTSVCMPACLVLKAYAFLQILVQSKGVGCRLLASKGSG